MAIITPVAPTPLPTPPSTNDPGNFDSRADAFLGALGNFQTETNALANATFNNAQESAGSASAAAGSASAATMQANAAAQSAAAAAIAAGAVKWVSGSTYAEGAVVWSPLNYLSYRRKSSGAGTVDPSNDRTNWALLGVSSNFPVTPISTNTNASTSIHYVFTSTAQLILPESPSVGAAVQFTDLSGARTSTIDPGSEKIRGASGVMLLNAENASATLTYSGSTLGWV